MKKLTKLCSTFIALFVLIGCGILLTGCDVTQALRPIPTKKPISTITQSQKQESSSRRSSTTIKSTEAPVVLDMEEASVECYEEITLTAIAAGSVTWTSSDTSIATVNNGKVRGIKVGTATITATCGNMSAECIVTVTESTATAILLINDDVEEVEVLETEGMVEVSVTPYWKTSVFEGDVVYSWKVVDGKDATLIELTSEEGTATIKGLKAGETEVMVTATYNGKDATATIPVIVKSSNIVAEIETDDYISLSDSLEYGYVLNLSMLESDSTVTSDALVSSIVLGKNNVTESTTISYMVIDDTIVSITNGGLVQALKAGDTNITVTYAYTDPIRGEKTTTVVVHVVVSKLDVELNETFTVEVSNVAPFTLASTIDGEIVDVLVGEVSVFKSASGNAITLDDAKLPQKVADGLGENKEAIIVTDKANYKITLNLYTKVINTKEDLDNMGALAKAASNDNGSTWDGYFVLGANIEYNGEFMGMTGKGNLWTSAGDYNAINTRGFKGVFDGKGYNINGMIITKNTYANQSFGFIGMLHPEGIIRNVSFTNAKAIDSDFLSFNFEGLAENIMIHFTELYSEYNFAGVVAGVKNHDNAVMKNCYFDCSNASITGSKTGLVEMEQNFSHKFKVENVFAVLPKGSNGKISEFTSFNALRSDDAVQTALESFDTNIWAITNGVPCFKNLLDDAKLALVNSPDTDIKSGETLEFVFNKNFYSGVLTLADGTETDMVFEGGKITVPNEKQYVGAYKLTVSDVYDSTNVYTFEFRVSYQVNISRDATLDLNYSTSGALGLTSYDFDLSSDNESFGDISSITIDGLAVTGTSAFNGGVLTLDIASLGKVHGKHQIVIKSSYEKADYNVTLNLLFVTKVINTKEDLDNMGAIAKAYSNDNGHTWDGYFTLGADIEYNGTFVGMFGTANVWSSEGNITDLQDKRGFKGVFDGCGHAIIGLNIVKNATGGAGSGFIPTVMSSAVIENVSFLKASVRDCGFISTSVNNGATFKNIYVQYVGFYGDTADTSTLSPNNNITSINAEGVFVDARVEEGYFLNSTGGWARARVFDRGTMFNNNNHCLAIINDVFATQESVHVVAKYDDFITSKSEWQQNIANWDLEYWDISTGIPLPKSLINDNKLALLNTPNTEAKSGETLEFKFNKYLYSAAITLADGTETDLMYSNLDTITIPNDPKYVGAYKLTVTDLFDETNVYTFEFSVSYQKNIVKDELVDFNYSTSGVIGLSSIDFDLSSEADDFGTVSSVTLDGVEVANLVTINGGKVSVSTEALGKIYGEHIIVILSENSGIKYSVKLNLLLATKVIKTKADLDNMGAIAKAYSNDGLTWDGYFALGNDIAYNGVYGGMFGIKNNWQSVAGIDNTEKRGFKGVFDGRGFNIDGMTINRDGENGCGYGFIPTLQATAVIKNVSFTNASLKNCALMVSSAAAGATLTNIYIQYKSFVAVGEATTSFFPSSRPKVNASLIFIDASRLQEFSMGTASRVKFGFYDNENFWGNDNWGCANELAIVSDALATGEGRYIAKTLDEYTSNAGDFWNMKVKLDAFKNDFWTVKDYGNGAIPVPKNLLNNEKLALLNSPITEAKSGDVIELEFNKYFYKTTLTMADGSETDMPLYTNKVVIPNDPKYVGAYKLTVTDLFDETNVYTFEFSVSYQKNIVKDELVDLNYSTSGAVGLANLELDLSDEVQNFGNITSIKLDGTDISASANAAFNGGVFTIPTTNLGSYGEHVLAIESDNNGAKYNTTLNLLVVTKVIKTKADLDNMGAIAKAYANDGLTWDGYFALGNDIAYNGVYGGMFGIKNNWQAVAGIDNTEKRGFKGVFDGRGFNIDGMTINRDGENGCGYGFIPTLQATAVIKNVSFTNASLENCAFLASNGAVGTLLSNIYIQYKSFVAIDQNTATYFPTSKPAITAEYIFIDGSMIEKFSKGSAGVVKLGNYNGEYFFNQKNWGCANENVQDESGKILTGETKYIAPSLEAYTSNADDWWNMKTKFGDWSTDFWEIVPYGNGAYPVPKNLINDTSELVLLNSPNTDLNTGDVVNFSFNKHYYKGVVTKADGTSTDLEFKYNKIVIPDDPSYAGAYKLTVTDLFDSTNVYTFEFNVTFTINNTINELVDLNYSTSGAIGLTNVEIDLSDIAADLGVIEAITLDGVDFSTSGAAINGSVLSIPASAFGKTYGDKVLVVGSDYNGGKFNTTINLTLATKVLKTKADIDNMGAIAKAYSNDGGHTWDGYFALGCDIEYNGLFSGMFGTANVWSANGNITDLEDKRGFKGVFDGQGHTIIGLEIVKNATTGAGSGFIPTVMSTAVIKNVSFTHASVTDCGYITTSINNGATYKNIYVQYDLFKGDTADTATFSPNNNIDTINAEYIFIDARVEEGNFLNSTGGWARARLYDRASKFNNNNHCLGVINDVFTTQESAHIVTKYDDFVAANSEWQQNIKVWDSTYWDVSSGLPIPKTLIK